MFSSLNSETQLGWERIWVQLANLSLDETLSDPALNPPTSLRIESSVCVGTRPHRGEDPAGQLSLFI